MTVSVAIWILKHITTDGIAKEATNMAIHALEGSAIRRAQIIEDGYTGRPSVCSYCGSSVLRYHKYCWNCGATFIKEDNEI